MKLNRKELKELLKNKKTFILLVSKDKCPNCDSLKLELNNFFIEQDILQEISYFNQYEKLNVNERKELSLPTVFSFPTIIEILNGKVIKTVNTYDFSQKEIIDEIKIFKETYLKTGALSMSFNKSSN